MAKSKSDSSSSTGSSESSTTKSTDTANSSDKGSGAEKAAKDSVGGSSQVHYGYFSSVRSDVYRSGWDSIWSAKPKGRRRKSK